MLQNKAIKDYRKLFCLLKDGTVFTVIDTETTGLSSIESRIVEVAAIKFSKDGILDKFSTLVNPEQKIPSQCIQIHHITDQMVQSAPKIKQILPDFLKFIEGSVLIGHNINFDLRFLNAELERNGFFQLKNSFIDTLSLSRWSLPEMQKYNQSILAEYFNIKIKNAHRAEDDAYVCGQIFLNCIKVSAERQKIRID